MSPEAPAFQAKSLLLSHWGSPVYRILWGDLVGERGEKSRDSEYGLGILIIGVDVKSKNHIQ